MAKKIKGTTEPEKGKPLISAVRQVSENLDPLHRKAALDGAAKYLRSEKMRAGMTRLGNYGGVGAGVSQVGIDQGTGIGYGSPQWYNPLIGSQDRYFYPAAQERQNTIWRMYYEMDPIIGTATDLFSDLPWSSYHLSGIKDKSVMRIFEESLEAINLRNILPAMTKEFLMKGKVVPHLIFSNTKGYWVHCAIHDPSYVGVTGLGLPGLPPLLDFIATPELQFVAKSNDPRCIKFRESWPEELILSVLSGKPIPLSDTNVTYIARKTCPYDVMGTSIYTRLFRTVMLEDALANSALAVARRNAVPLRVFKLGDPQSGWIPSDADYDDFLMKIEQAEMDPAAILLYHFGLEVEYVGVTDKMWKISDEADYLTKMKLSALGMPESLIHGEVSFSSAESGLQVMIERLAALRQRFMSEWVVPKLLKPIALANKTYKTTPANMLMRTRRGETPVSDSDLLVPTLRWEKPLEVKDQFILNTYKDLMDRGFVSNSSYAKMAAGVDLEAEVESLGKDKELRDRAAEILGTGGGGPAGQPRSAAMQRSAAIDRVVGLFTDGHGTGDLSGVSPSDLGKVSKYLANYGVDKADDFVERLSSTLNKYAGKREDLKQLVSTTPEDPSIQGSKLFSGM